MEKEAYYFPHFSNARHDRKIQRLRKELGIEGYGIFFMLLETLRDQIDLKYPMSDIDLLADEFGTSEQKLRTVIANYQLFELDEDELFFSPRMLVYLQPYFNMKEQRKIAGRASAEARKNKLLELSFNDRSMDDEQSKVKEKKEKESKVNEIYSLYPTTDSNNNNKSTGKSSKDKLKIGRIIDTDYPLKKAIEFYLSECNRTKCYLKNFGTFLNNLPDVELLEDKPQEQKKPKPTTDLKKDVEQMNAFFEANKKNKQQVSCPEGYELCE